MQKPQPCTLNTYESKILRRRNKTFSSAAVRSRSQPKILQKGNDLHSYTIVDRRSLSTPRYDDESSLGNNDFPLENLTRLEQNLRRFEIDRLRFENEKNIFEQKQRERIAVSRQLLCNEDRKRLCINYFKLSNRKKIPSNELEHTSLAQNVRLHQNEASTIKTSRRSRHRENDVLLKNISFDPEEQQVIDEYNSKNQSNNLKIPFEPGRFLAAPIRGPPPLPPVIEHRERNHGNLNTNKIVRNQSLSPIRPKRRSISKTPDSYINAEKTSLIHTANEKTTLNANTLSHSTVSNLTVDNLISTDILQKENLNVIPNKNILISKQPDKEQIYTQHLKSPVLEAYKTDKISEPTIQINFFKPDFFKADSDSKNKCLNLKFLENITVYIANWLLEAQQEWLKLKQANPNRVFEIKQMRNKCFTHIIQLILLLGFGGLMFRYTEGLSENIYKCEVRKVKRDFIENLWKDSHIMREDDWKSLARQKLHKFEDELNKLAELGLQRIPGQKSWNFVNCIIYCWTIVTTIGYGHITPKTTLGRMLTIIYAIIGIPLFLIVLADFGKLFTRSVKFLWAYVRRVYYTRSCRRIRKQQQIRDAMTGFNTVYDLAIRRPSMFFTTSTVDVDILDPETGKSIGSKQPETPISPYPETFEVDDEFNLPVSVASMLLIGYILLGAFGYTLLERDWTYVEAFYFVFISMSTIGFGDMVPNNPFYMMISIIYLIFGLALTSMFINVVQIKLSDHFSRASAKVSATIGMGLVSEMGDEPASQIKIPSEIASTHEPRMDFICESDLDRAPGTEFKDNESFSPLSLSNEGTRLGRNL